MRREARSRRYVAFFAVTLLAGTLLVAGTPGAWAEPAAPAAQAPHLAPIRGYLGALQGLNRPRAGLMQRASAHLARPLRRGEIMKGLTEELHRVTRPDARGAPQVSHTELHSLLKALQAEQEQHASFDAKTFRQLSGVLNDRLARIQHDEAQAPEAAEAAPASEAPVAEARPATPPAPLGAEANALVEAEANPAVRAAMVRALRESGVGAPELVVRQPAARWSHDPASAAQNPSVHALQPAGAYTGPSVVGRSLNMSHMGTVIEQQGAGAATGAILQAMRDRRDGFYQHLLALHKAQLSAAAARGIGPVARGPLREQQASIRKTFLRTMGSSGRELIRDSDGVLRIAVRSSGEIGAEKAHLRGAVKAEKKHQRWAHRAEVAAANQAQFETKKTHWVTMGAGALALGAVMLSVTGVGLATLPLLIQGSTALAAWTQVGMVAGGVFAGGATGQFVANRVQGLRAGLNGAWLRAADRRKDEAAAAHRATLSYYNLDPNAPAANENHFSSPPRRAFPSSMERQYAPGAARAPAVEAKFPDEAPADAPKGTNGHPGFDVDDHRLPEAA
ncbi:MAG: hypothetical protein IPL40_11570 [Proteobacteria bacterium]|nr:hypothetical protein [Pseudomonadota bacterium]